MVLLVMGVTGSGKSTVGRIAAQRLGWLFLEADDFHSPANRTKMRRGIPLTDADRVPWLDAIHAALGEHEAGRRQVVLACSALKADYRRRLLDGLPATTVYLKGPPDLIRSRLRERPAHFAGESILDDQFEILEEPSPAVVIDVRATPEAIATAIVASVSAAPGTNPTAPRRH